VAQYLSIRESEILQLVSHGRSTKEIAADLAISESTVNWHVSNVLSKLGASTRAEAVALYIGGDRSSADSTERIPTIDVAPRATHRWRLRALALAGALCLVLVGGAPLVAARQQATIGPSVTAAPTATPTTMPTASGTPTAAPEGTAGPSPRATALTPAPGAPQQTSLPAPTIAPPTLSLPTLAPTPLPMPTLPPVPTLPPLGP